MEKEKPSWKVWDEFFIDAWERGEKMFITAFNFLSRCGAVTSYEQMKSSNPQQLFASIGVSLRSPKIQDQLHGSVKAFFSQFFPDVNELLWQGKKSAALRKMRCYKVGGDRLRQDRELEKSKRDTRRKKSPSIPLLIPDTNAIRVVDARRRCSDWNTVKPSRCRQRTKRL